ncbi:alpha/beta hydrolase [Parvibaculum sp.]|uniref:alpha/beta hydrolase n=1 Tax=Parvibaculum sp. TaxID=2024848 RepID=UPI000C8AEE67|nr:alpha/beta hydrolase [Parvibaculum sp.]MAB14891.1 alpha/beta hydrolase [Parvibaculum sp.]
MFPSASDPIFWRAWSEFGLVAEYGALAASYPALLKAPRGDGHGVLVLPGMLTGDESTSFLRTYLKELGYVAHAWRQGHNWGPSRHIHRKLKDRVNELADECGRAISIVGWSLGGIYARELAREFPDQVRQVITLGSPFGAGYRVSGEVDPKLAERLRVPPPVPSTSIYSRFDGLVPWAACREQETPQTENIEVPATHLGMGGNPLVFWAVADRLSQAEGEWKHFDRSGFHKWFYV